ncbi:Uncharacterised protein [Salmonella enterica subsp. enterica serovar Bovismorbificans]|nr:Uncharacterised protein [Salmonella enterica subsp. enterica serovar Bovismorbificans]
MPQMSIGRPIFAYSKKPKPPPIFCSADCAIRFPGAPINDRLPPNAAAKTSGISRREREKPDFAATPITTGIKTAAVPVLERTPDIKPTTTIMVKISCFSVFAKRVMTPPTLFAIPVSNNAPPTINIATKRMTLVSIKPAKACLIFRTPVITKATQTIMEVTASGTFSHTNMTIANTNKHKVRVMGSIFIIIQSMIYDIVSNVDREKLFPYKN